VQGPEDGFWGLVGKPFLPDGNGVFGVLVGFPSWERIARHAQVATGLIAATPSPFDNLFIEVMPLG
jgi:hypothetical protein